jgi:hypothetical protein
MFLDGGGGIGGAFDADVVAVDGGAVDPAWMPPTDGPVAVNSASCSQLTCWFDGSNSYDSSAGIVTYHWDFGDGTSYQGPSISHTYAREGRFSTALTVTDAGGPASTIIKTVTVVAPIPNLPPTISIASPLSCASYGAPAKLTISAIANDPDGSIQRVEFYAAYEGGGASLISIAWIAPYTISWPDASCAAQSVRYRGITR